MERREWRQHYLRATRKHPLTSVQSSPASVLNFLDFGTSLSNDRTHSRVGNHELDGNCSASGNRRLVKRFVIDPTDNETERLVVPAKLVFFDEERIHALLTLETASNGPLTLRMRSGFPGMLSETMTLAPDFSLISLT